MEDGTKDPTCKADSVPTPYLEHVCCDAETQPQLDAMLERSYMQSLAGQGKPLDEVFDNLERKLIAS